MTTTNVFKKNITAYNAGFRRIVNQGGTSSSKTFSILQLLLLIAVNRQGTSISVMSETMPHLKRGVIRDFEKILKAENLYDERNVNRTDHIYRFGDSFIEFFSADSPGKVVGARRDILYVNECNNISYRIVEDAEIRTDKCIFYDFNPTAEFWIVNEVYALPDAERCIIKSNYLDNSQLSASICKDIQLKASRSENYKRVHIDAEFGITEGLIFTTPTLVDAMPVSDRESHGLDFGFTNDPSALVQTIINDGKLWLRQRMYDYGMTNRMIYDHIKSTDIGRKRIIADSSEPKSIHELSGYGLNIHAAQKGPDSVRQGIDKIKQYSVCITKESVDLIKEWRNYQWKVDKKSGLTLNVPLDAFNHGVDATRYALEELTVGGVKAPTFHFNNRR